MESLQAVGDLKTEGPNFAVATLVTPLLEFEIEEAIYVGGEGEVRQVFAFPAAHFLQEGARDAFFLPCSQQFVRSLEGLNFSHWRLERKQKLSLTTLRGTAGERTRKNI